MSDINEFISRLKTGMARSNRFRVELVYPSIVGEDGSLARFAVKAANLPASTLGVIDVPYMGRTFKQPGDRTFAEWTVTIMNEVDFKHRNALERWSNAINSHVGNGRLSDDIYARATVSQLDISTEPKVIKQYVFENLWPSEVAAIDVGFDNNDTNEEFSVTFQYSHWTAVTTS